MKTIFYLFISVFLFVSCDKGEIPVKKPDVTLSTVQVNMGSDYGNQLFFDLYSQNVVLVNNRENWDLGFKNGENDKSVFLNSSKLMSCAKSSTSDILSLSSSTGLEFHYDSPTGNTDSTAIGDWWNSNSIFIIDRGVTTTGSALGKIKLKFISVDSEKYIFEWANLSNIISTNIDTIFKNDTYRLTTFSFDTGITQSEPLTSNWQLCFTSYTHVFEDGTPYLVTGVLSNEQQIQVSKTVLEFESISYTNAITSLFSTDRNSIGYDWKEYNFDLSQYVVDMTKTYIIKDNNNRIFKLRFIDFYTDSGVKGAPKFEIVELI